MNRDDFAQQIAENPNDVGLQLIFADWLEERGEIDEAVAMRDGNAEDARLIRKALLCGWEWFENVTNRWPGTKEHPARGWLDDGGSFKHCQHGESKAHYLRAQRGNPAFDHEYVCHECGKPIWLMWLDNAELIRLRECFRCHHWLSLIRRGTGIVRMFNGAPHHYMVGDRKESGPFNGFGGNKYTIRMHDGRTIETCDLWHQGEIPERFWDRLPVNAE